MSLMHLEQDRYSTQAIMFLVLQRMAEMHLPITVHGSACFLIMFGPDSIYTKDIDIDWLEVSCKDKDQDAVAKAVLTAVQCIDPKIRINGKRFAGKLNNARYKFYRGLDFVFKCDIAYKDSAPADEYTLPTGSIIRCQNLISLIADRVAALSNDSFVHRTKDICPLLILSKKSGFTQTEVLTTANESNRSIGKFTKFSARDSEAYFWFNKENDVRHYELSLDEQIDLITPFLQPFIDKYYESPLIWTGELWKFKESGKPWGNQRMNSELLDAKLDPDIPLEERSQPTKLIGKMNMKF